LETYKKYLWESLNYLNFWGRIDYQSIKKMPTYRRRWWIKKTEENLKILFPKKN
jgi:hypothetical protein